MNAQNIKKIFLRFQKNNPNPQLELQYTTPFELLVAVVLSAQATDVSVNKVTRVLFPVANTPQKMLSLGEAGLKTYIKSIGLFNSKASNLIKTCQILIEKHAGEVPCVRKALESLPGVGRKTANVILHAAFGETTIAVDTHVFRVSNRIPLGVGNTPDAVEEELMRVIPRQFLPLAHYWLVLHGRYVCKAKKPDCAHCLINDLCEFQEKTSISAKT